MSQDHTRDSALAHLRGRGYVLDSGFWWNHPNVANEVTEEDMDAVDFLFYEWDFGWLKETLEEDEMGCSLI